MTSVITTTLSPSVLEYIRRESKQKKITHRKIIEEGIKYYRKEQLKQQVREWLIDRQDEYRAIAAEFRDAQGQSLKL